MPSVGYAPERRKKYSFVHQPCMIRYLDFKNPVPSPNDGRCNDYSLRSCGGCFQFLPVVILPDPDCVS